jgi:Flp pilus assembly protein TadG
MEHLNTSSPNPREATTPERGVGILSSVFGLMFFLVFMLLAVQVMWSLYATSVVTAAAYDAGRVAARTGDPTAGEARFENTIGEYDADVAITVPAGPGIVTVVVTGENPTVLPSRFARVLPFGTINRTVEVRNEVFVSDE